VMSFNSVMSFSALNHMVLCIVRRSRINFCVKYAFLNRHKCMELLSSMYSFSCCKLTW
jgi:hypothetical protein